MVVCGKCELKMHPVKTGVFCEVNDGVYSGDLLRCPECGHKVVSNFGERICGKEDEEFSKYIKAKDKGW